jgi:hypothetical protein
LLRTAFDLHVLGTPPALILSQDQTLMLNSLFSTFTLAGSGRSQLFNARTDDLALRCFRTLCLPRLTTERLTLDGLACPSLGSLTLASVRTN